MPFNTQASINLADDPELMQMMVEAGFDTVFVGIETPDEESLAECHKTQNRSRDLVEDVKRIQRAGLEVQGGFIVGFDSDAPDIFQRQIDFIQQSGIVTAMVGLLQAPPGTRLYRADAARRAGCSARSTGDNVDGTTNIVPRHGPGRLLRGYRRLLLEIYTPRGILPAGAGLLRECRPPPGPGHSAADGCLAFFRSLAVPGHPRPRTAPTYWGTCCLDAAGSARASSPTP